MSSDGVMVPDDVRKAVAEREEQLNQQEKQEAIQAAEAEKRRQTNEEWKESQFPQSLARAKEVIEWAKGAAKEDAVKRLIALEEGTYHNGPLLFCEAYLHYEPAGFGAYACTYLLKNGSLLYIESYKWYGISTRRQFHEPKQLAKALHPTYIKNLHDCLMSGKVWNGVSRRVKTTIAEDDEWFGLTNEDKESPNPRESQSLEVPSCNNWGVALQSRARRVYPSSADDFATDRVRVRTGRDSSGYAPPWRSTAGF